VLWADIFCPARVRGLRGTGPAGDTRSLVPRSPAEPDQAPAGPVPLRALCVRVRIGRWEGKTTSTYEPDPY